MAIGFPSFSAEIILFFGDTKIMKRILLAALLGLAVSGGESSAQADTLVPFDQFLRQTASVPAPAGGGANPQSAQSTGASFEEGRQHILKLYQGVQVKHSYLVGAHPYDCVPIAQQPSVRLQNLTSIASPPPTVPFSSEADPASPGHGSAPMVAQIDPKAKTDSLGNALSCEDGTIPMRRVTLDALSRFKSLHEFFEKGPNGSGHAGVPNPAAKPNINGHAYAHSYQYVSNVGGSADLSLWNPAVNTSLGEIFSLSQYWFVNTNGTTQTLEAGLQAYPQKYNTNNSVLFIYWTADNYNKTGCYNLDCPGFVQTNKNVYLGAGFTNYSTVRGTQYAVQIVGYLYQGNWWIYLGGGNASNAIGYYPGSLYGGQQMSKGANEIDFGGETVGSTIWPPMGSGVFAAKGFGQAAFIKNIQYYPDASHFSYANLQVSQPSISCYTDVTHDNSGQSSWQTYFFFGGPGGRGC